MRRIIFCKLLIFVILTISVELHAQRTKVYQQPEFDYRTAVDLFHKEKYEASRLLFGKVIKQIDNPQSLLISESKYYAALCDAYLFHKNAESELLDFINQYPESSRYNEALLELGNYYYSIKDFVKAGKAYEQVDVRELLDKQKGEFYFKKGYAYFNGKKINEAKLAFYESKEIASSYAPLALYYYAYIQYTEKNYATALKDFEKLKDDENFGKIIPYYIVQIHYKQGKYDQVLQEAPALLENATPRRAAEVARLIGESYYYTDKYNDALPYLRIFFDQSATVPTKDDDYILGFTYYSLGNYDTAIIHFQRVAMDNTKDAFTQNALYHLAYCYVQKEMKKFAMTAFQDAAKLDFDKRMQEDAAYNYAKMAYELSLTPYNESLNAFQSFLDQFPDSRFTNEIYGYLVNIFLTTKNYKEALTAYDKIKRKDGKMQEAYQRITFNRGVEFFNMGAYDSAATMFDRSYAYNFDETLGASSIFWKADAYYRMSNYKKASDGWETFVITTGSDKTKEYNQVFYDLGYAYLLQKKYDKAAQNFQKFIDKTTTADVLTADAYVREGDALFMQKLFKNAIPDYDKAIAMNSLETDHALYNKSLCLGALGKFDTKVETLKLLLNNYHESTYVPQAMNELAATYLVLENNTKAMETYRLLASKYNNSSMGRIALLKQGLIYYNTDNNDKALSMYESVINQYPGTEEAKEALVGIRKIYIETNRVDAFFEYAKRIQGTQINAGEQDSITYFAAENQYMAGDCENAVKNFAGYTQKFPAGFFILNATFYLADCQYRTGDFDNAFKNYEKITKMSNNKYSYRAEEKVAALAFANKDYKKALESYQKLLKISDNASDIANAKIFIMRCYNKLNNDADVILSAQEVLELPKLSPDIQDEANWNIAKAALNIGNYTIADAKYKLLEKSKNPEYNAEAKYYAIYKLFKDGKYDQAEKAIFAFINEAPSSERFLAMCYILWGDIYKERGNLLQAKQTYQSIIDNYDGEDLIEVAKQKKLLIDSIEAEKLKNENKIREENAGVDDDDIIYPEE